MSRAPKVSVGLPVFNGERYLEVAIRSILAQTFSDFELIISDNASTDGTEAICRRYATQDDRVRYVRNEHNIGLFPNFNRVFRLSSGTYFKWAAHDDICRPDFLATCVEVLDHDAGVAISYPRAMIVDAKGEPLSPRESRPEFDSPRPHRRFRESLVLAEPIPQSGLTRSAVLRRTSLFGPYPLADLVLLAEVSLYGRFYEVPDFLFLHREHPGRSVRAHDWRDPHSDIAWLDPQTAGKSIFPQWRLLAEHVAAVRRAPLGWRERAQCCAELGPWVHRYRGAFVRDAVVALERFPRVGMALTTLRKSSAQTSWNRRLRRMKQEIEPVIPAGHDFILVDDGTFGMERLDGRRAIPFLERDGQYWGAPPDDDTAIRELDRQRRSGAQFIVFGWPSFWWLDSYKALHRHLRSNFRCALENSRVLVFDLRSTFPDRPAASD